MTRAPGSCARSPRRRCATARRAAGISRRIRARCESRPSTRSPIGSRASCRSPPAPAARCGSPRRRGSCIGVRRAARCWPRRPMRCSAPTPSCCSSVSTTIGTTSRGCSRATWRGRLTEELLGPEYAAPPAREALRSCIGQWSRVAGSARLLQAVAALPAAALSAADEAAIAALSRVLEHAARELHVEFAQAGRVDYTYVTGAARAALADAGLPTELALRTGLAFTHILVDEFQDTSLAQFQLLESLTAAWQQGDGRTLFIVGDPMQSIYRFRDAEVGLFISAREHGIGNVRLTPLRLTRNFRATPALVDWSNEVFAQVFPAADELRAGAIAFSASVPARVRGERSPPAQASVQLRLFPGDRDAEARSIATHISALRGREPDARVAVLVAAHAHAVPIVNA